MKTLLINHCDRADMLALFEPVVRQICELVHKQIAAVRKQMNNLTVNVSKTKRKKQIPCKVPS